MPEAKNPAAKKPAANKSEPKPLVKKSDSAKKTPGEKVSAAPSPAARPAAKKGGKKKGKRGRKKKKPKLSPEEQRRLELVKWMSVRPQLLAERIAQSKLEKPYFLTVEYALMADMALARREQEKMEKQRQDVQEKQLKDREHLIQVTERHFDFFERRFQKALENWDRIEARMEELEEQHDQKFRDINRKLYLRKQETCRRFREQEMQDRLQFKEEARIGRILSKKYN